MASTGVNDCAPATCPVQNGYLSEPPSLTGAAILLSAFALLVLVTVWLGARWRLTTYSLTLVTGLILEVIGYLGRLLLRSDPASKTYFLLFLLGTILGPTFVTAAVYTVLPHVLVLYGTDVSIVQRPIWLNYFFLIFDLCTLFFQALGSAFAAEGFDRLQIQQGTNCLLAGLALQLATIFIFFGLYIHFVFQLAQNREFIDPQFSDVYLSPRFKTALLYIQISLILILVRTIARMIQVSSGFASALSQSQVYIPVLDGALVLVAVLFLTIRPPAAAFGRAWAATSPWSPKASGHHHHHHHYGPGSPLRSLYGSPVPSPLGGGGDAYHMTAGGAGAARRYSPGWPGHKRQPSATSSGGNAEPPPYERPAISRVPYVPPPTPSRVLPLSQPYGQGRVVESHIVAPRSEGTRTGGSGSGSGSGSGGGRSTRTRTSPRAYGVDLVSHDAIW